MPAAVDLAAAFPCTPDDGLAQASHPQQSLSQPLVQLELQRVLAHTIPCDDDDLHPVALHATVHMRPIRSSVAQSLLHSVACGMLCTAQAEERMDAGMHSDTPYGVIKKRPPSPAATSLTSAPHVAERAKL